MLLNYISLISFLPLVFIIPCIISLFTKRKNSIDPSKLAYGATALGILLTFVGIWQGLIGFDVSRTEESIPILLEGLKTAFGSSIAGLATSITINLFFVSAEEPEERSLANIEDLLLNLNQSLESFTLNLAEANIEALGGAINELVQGLEMGINSETQETIGKFKNAIVTEATTKHLDRTNEVLAELKPVTETIAESIGWVQNALPSFRPRANSRPRVKNSSTIKKKEDE